MSARDAPFTKRFPYPPKGAGGSSGKGSSGSSSSPVDDPDTLQSVAFVSLLDLLCEGEIEGLVGGAAGIYLDGVPMEIVDDVGDVTQNFTGATVGWVNGTQTQDYIPGFSGLEATTTLNLQVTASVPVITQIDNSEANAVIATLGVGALNSTNQTTGDISGASVEIAVDYQATGGSWIQAIAATITGKTSSHYERSYRFDLTGTGPWTVRVRRITADSTSDLLNNTTFIDAVSEVIDRKLSYPNSAMVGIIIDARQFSAIPTRTYLVQGLKIKIPSNYNPVTRIYTGEWDGSFRVAYCNCPPWCLYDLLTSTRYGVGNYVDADEIDTASLYEIGQYCDEMVPDGFGGQEPRFALNVCLNTQKDAYTAIQDIVSVFRGMTYWGVGSVFLTQDAPTTPLGIFSPANVVGGVFNYAGSARKDRHTVANVTYNDPDQQYIQATEYVEDPDGIDRYGVKPVTIMAVGTTSRGQAARLGLWTLYTERLNTDTLTFQAGMEGALVRPGQVIQIADPTRATRRMGGRTLGGTTTRITLDAPIEMDAGETYTLFYYDATGTQYSVEVGNTNTVTDTLVFSTTQAAAPQVGFMWSVSASGLNTQLFRVVDIQESSRNLYDITAVSYNESKFDGVDFGTALAIPVVTAGIALAATLPTNWSINTTTYLSAPGMLGQKIIMSWTGNTTAYQLQYRVNAGVWVTVQLSTPTFEILGVSAGDVYDFRIFGKSADGTLSNSLDETYTIPPKSVAPGAPTSLTAAGSFLSVILNWAAPSNIDLAYFQVFQSANNDVSTASLVANFVSSTTATISGLPGDTTWYYWVRAVNTSGVIGPFNSNTGTSGFALKGQSAMFENLSVTNAIIANAAISTAKIQNAAITTALIGTAQITNALIGTAAVGTLTIAGNAVTTGASWNMGPSSSVNYTASGGDCVVLVSAVVSSVPDTDGNRTPGSAPVSFAGQGITLSGIDTLCTGVFRIPSLSGTQTLTTGGGSANFTVAILENKR